MSDFYTVLRRSLDRADAPDEAQRQEIYDRLRAVIVRKLDAHRPRLKDTEFRHRLVAFDDAVVRIEDEIAASFAAADDVFDGLPYEGAPAAPPVQPAELDDLPYEAEDPAEEAEGEAFLFTDEEDGPAEDEELPAEEYAADEDAEPHEYAAEPAPVAYEPEPEQDLDPELEPEWTPEPDVAEPGEGEVAETAGPSTMWGSPAIDLAWDETTAQWHDPEEPVRPMPAPAAPPPQIQARPDSEWDRRLQMALAEETVRNRGAAAAPEWISTESDPDLQPDDSTFFDEGQWDSGGAPLDDVEPLPGKGGGRLGAVTSRLRALSPGRFLRRGKREAANPAPPAEAPVPSRDSRARLEPDFGMPVEEEPPRAVERRASVRGVMIDDDGAPANEPARPLRARRDDFQPPPEPPPSRRASAVRPEPAVPPDRPAARRAAIADRAEQSVRPIRPTPAPQPSRLGDSGAAPRREQTGRPARPAPPQEDDEDRTAAPDVTWPTRPAARSRSLPAPSPVETPAAQGQTRPQRGLRPRPAAPPPASDRPGEQRSLAPAGNRAVRYLGSDLDDAPDELAPPAAEPLFAEAMDPPAQRRRQPPRNAPPDGRRLVYERTYGSQILKFGVIGAIIIVLAICAAIFVPGLLGRGETGTGGAADAAIVLFDGTDPLVFQAGPDNPVTFEGDTAGGLVRVASSSAGAARASIGPGIANGVESRQVRIQIDVRSTPNRPASTLRLAYLRGNTLLEWRTVNVTGDFAIVDAIWTVPAGAASANGDALLIAPGVPGDGTAVDIRRITIDVGE